MTMVEGFPLELESLLASTVEILKERGAAREIGIIANSEARMAVWESSRFDATSWGIWLAVDLAVYARMDGAERREVEGIIEDAAQSFFAHLEEDRLGRVNIVPLTSKAPPGWRDSANAWLAGAGVNNQGRVRSDNIAALKHEGLLFRSPAEVNLYSALKAQGVTFAPLPVFVRGGRTYHRLEPDFVIIKDGVVMVVEVDGDTYHRESPADAHQRLLPLDHEGAKVERVRAEECATPHKAEACARRLITVLEKRRTQRA